MSVGYFLVNETKREIIRFLHIPTSTAKELAGNPISAAISTWYMLQNAGDRIAFVSDTLDDWRFANSSETDLPNFNEVTNQVVQSLIEAGILADDGIAWTDETDPDNVYIRATRNIWME